ncbi:hypothetical protein RCL_jg11437.t1 [Rhizophagus clarus]|uniref:Uncharacterized protein n=1 Tax=Rhizophagus clarus TaxID=94130 RepID=A0A8H3LC36_9GLOM|nr:hypothetical protein RCL_jg11437.t1 [Rhizophagus clarus]
MKLSIKASAELERNKRGKLKGILKCKMVFTTLHEQSSVVLSIIIATGFESKNDLSNWYCLLKTLGISAAANASIRSSISNFFVSENV